MKKIHNSENDNFIKYIIAFINSNTSYKNKFNHFKQKIQIEKLFSALIYKLKSGVSFRDISYNEFNIKWQTLYYFHNKIVRLKFFENFYDDYINKYINNVGSNINEFFMDSTLIANKLGIDDTTYNMQLLKHKSTKISIITDEFNVPISYKITDSNNHDSPIIQDQIIDLAEKFPIICDNKKTFIGDAGYDSLKIENILRDKNIGILDTPKNKRNTKNSTKIKKINLYSKMLHNRRCKIEHTNNLLKKYKTINVRFQKYSRNFKSFVCLALCMMAYHKIGCIEKYT